MSDRWLRPEETVLLGQLLFQETLPEWCEGAEMLARKPEARAFLFWKYGEAMPEPERELCRKAYQIQAGFSLVHEVALQKLEKELTGSGLEYVPLKGSYLAYHVYPRPALRPFGDLDLWIRKRQLPSFLAKLEALGWKTPLDCYTDHHAGMRHLGKVSLEPHFALPNISEIHEELLWRETDKTGCGEAGPVRFLSPELTLLMLCQHNSICEFQDTNTLKLLLDAGFLLKRFSLDWKKAGELARACSVPHPGILLLAFPEVFPAEYCPESLAIPHETVEVYRQLLMQPKDFRGNRGAIERRNASLFSRVFWIRRLHGLASENIRWKYHLKKREFWKIQFYRIYDCWKKVWLLFHRKRQTVSPELEEHLKRVASIERLQMVSMDSDF